MTTIEQTLQGIRNKISTVQAQQARASVEYDNAVERATAARTVLKDEFGVTTTAEAKALKTQLEDELAEAIQQAQAELEAAGV